jgi:tetratricopeptide (TPR) repeat protein
MMGTSPLRRLRLPALALLLSVTGAAALHAAQSALELSAAGSAAQSAGNFHLAVEKYKAALAVNPSYSAPMVGLAESFFLLEEYDEAARWVADARRLDRESADLMVLEGRIRIGAGDVPGARALFTDVLSRQPNNLEARFGMAEAEVAEGRARNALSLYGQALRLAPESVKALLSLAVLSDETGDAASADRYLDMALRAHSDDPQVQLAAGRHLALAGDLAGAEKRARIALSLRDDLEPARMLLGSVLLQAGRAADAAEVFRQVITANRDNAMAWYGLGVAYARTGDPAKAISSLSTGLSVRPEDELARAAEEGVAMDSLKMDDPQRKKLGAYHYAQGSQLETRNFQEKALAEYRRALLLDPTSRDARVAYARIFRAMGFPARYLNELKVLAKLGVKDTFVGDEVEGVASDLAGSLSETWGVDQFALERRRYTVPVFTVPRANRLLHPQADVLVARSFTDMLTRVESLTVPAAAQSAASFEEAFRTAREQGTDYFLVLQADESERTFSASASLYLSRTGGRIASFSAFRTGNDRVRDTFLKLISQTAGVFPPRGILLQRRFDEGLVDLGTFNGIKKDDKMVIVKRGKVSPDPQVPGIVYAEGDVLGDFTVQALDEGVTSGTVARRGPFDFVNAGDEVVYALAKKAPPSPATAGGGGNILTRLFGIKKQ